MKNFNAANYALNLHYKLKSSTFKVYPSIQGFLGGASDKETQTQVQSLVWEHPEEESMATHSSIFAWIIPWTEEPGKLQSMESKRFRHN